jgi:hypothetical protein
MYVKKIWMLILLAATCLRGDIRAQIILNNPSFEGEAKPDRVPIGWSICRNGTTPDILPGPWGVWLQPADGLTYLGLTARNDGTWEVVGQQLATPLRANECYNFSVDLARADTYAGHNLPLRLRIWGGTNACMKSQLLCETGLVRHTDWRKYDFLFFTKQSFNFILLEAFYGKGLVGKYKGNLLLDACSEITPCPRVSR